MSHPALHDLEARARWHLAIGYPTPEDEARDAARELAGYDDDEPGYYLCPNCGEPEDGICQCHAGDECGRWRNGRLSSSCLKAGSEECDFECPHRATLRF